MERSEEVTAAVISIMRPKRVSKERVSETLAATSNRAVSLPMISEIFWTKVSRSSSCRVCSISCKSPWLSRWRRICLARSVLKSVFTSSPSQVAVTISGPWARADRGWLQFNLQAVVSHAHAHDVLAFAHGGEGFGEAPAFI